MFALSPQFEVKEFSAGSNNTFPRFSQLFISYAWSYV